MLMFFVSSVRRRRIQAGYPRLSRVRALGPEGFEDLTCRNETDNRNTSGFNRLSPALFTVYQCEYASYGAICRTYGFNSAKRWSASSDYVLYHSHSITLFERPLDRFSCPVRFCLLSHRERSQRTIRSSAGVADSIRNWIGTEGET